MDGKLKKRLGVYSGYSYDELALKALYEKGELKRKEDIAFLKKAAANLETLFECSSFMHEKIAKSLSKLVSIPYVNIQEEFIDRNAILLISPNVVHEKEALPILLQGKKLVVAVVNPLKIKDIGLLRSISEFNVRFVLCQRLHFQKVFDKYFNLVKKDEGFLGKKEEPVGYVAMPEGGRGGELHENIAFDINDTSAVSLVNKILNKAVSLRATDIHFESRANEIRVRTRIDGMLYELLRIPQNLQKACISRLKVLASLDITETRQPQDGRISALIKGKEQHFRVSSIQTKMGENVVLRIFKESNMFAGLGNLGMSEMDIKLFKSIILRPHGMVLVTGPVGSGKTTTLYTALQELDTNRNKVITIEDPVECLLDGVSQVEVDSKVDINFVNSLRAVLRHDSDILMVGEVRDNETAKIAVRAALTGQQLFSTLHAVDTVSAITTLRNFDVPPFLIASALNGIVAQRLVRKICDSCKEEYAPSVQLLKDLNIEQEGVTFAYGKGCEKCADIGFYGQTGIFEVLQINDELRDAIIGHADENEIKKITKGMKLSGIRECGVKKIVDKVTTPEEVMQEILLEL